MIILPTPVFPAVFHPGTLRVTASLMLPHIEPPPDKNFDGGEGAKENHWPIFKSKFLRKVFFLGVFA